MAKKAKKKVAKKPKKTKPQKKPEKVKVKKEDLLKKYKTHPQDSGSVQVQIVLLTEKIKELGSHLKKHPKDFDSKLGLLKMIGQRRRLLNYLRKRENKMYESLIIDLGLRK